MTKKMIGTILIIIGLLTLVSGIIVYVSPKKQLAPIDMKNDLQQVIRIAIADGVLTVNERKIIKQLAIDGNLDYDEIIQKAETEMAELNIVSETEIINFNKKNGDDFEKFIVQKFDKKYFNIKEWAGDKYVNGIYADTTPQPDLLVELKLSKLTTGFFVECKWRQKLYKGGVEFASNGQFKRYKDFEKTKNSPVFIAIGIGNKGISPEHLYIVPLSKLNSNFIYEKALKKFEKNIDSEFFFQIKTKELK